MDQRPDNALLRALTAESFESLRPHLASVELKRGDYIQHDGEAVPWVYFPETSVLSEISTQASGEGVETSMTGNEGCFGFIEACGSQVASVDTVVQVDGRATRIQTTSLRAAVLADSGLAVVCWRMAELKLAESRQSGLCQALHSVEARFARWMLEAAERSGGRNPLPMTQGFLAAMLGVQRTTVSMHASILQSRGLITYSRGQIGLVDLAGLERVACACRRVTVGQRARLGFRAIPVVRQKP